MDNNYENNNFSPNEEQTPVQMPEQTPEQPVENVEPPKKSFFTATVKRIVIMAIAAVLALSLLGGGVYAIFYNFVLFPTMEDAIANALEAKFDFDFNFNFDSFADKGTFKLGVNDMSELGLEGVGPIELAIASDMKKNAVGVFGTFNDDKISIFATEKGIALNENNFNNGTYYGISLDDFVEKLKKSIFGPDSDTEYALPTEAFDAIEQFFDGADELEDSELADDIVVIFDEIFKTFEDSEISEYETTYDKIKVLGEERSGKGRIYTIDEKKVEKLIKSFAEKLENPDKKLDEALDNIIGKIEDESDVSIDLEDLAELIDEAADQVGKLDFEAEITVLCVGRALSAVLVDVSVEDVPPIELTIDFGAKPKKDATIKLALETSVDGAKAEFLLTYELKKEKGLNEIALTLDASAKDGENTRAIKGEASIAFDSNKGTLTAEGEITQIADEFSFTYGAFGQCKYTDSKDTWSITPEKFGYYALDGDVEEEREEFEMPIDVTFTLSTKTESLKLPKYENLLEYSEEDMENLIDKLEEFGIELAERYGELFGAFDDIPSFGGGTDIPVVPGVEVPSYPAPYPQG